MVINYVFIDSTLPTTGLNMVTNRNASSTQIAAAIVIALMLGVGILWIQSNRDIVDNPHENFTDSIDLPLKEENQTNQEEIGTKLPPEVLRIDVLPPHPKPNDLIIVRFEVNNPNDTSISEEIWVESLPDYFSITIELEPFMSKICEFNMTRTEPKEYAVTIGELTTVFKITKVPESTNPEPSEEPQEVIEYVPNIWTPDPATGNMTNILPPEASPLRLSLPVPINSLYGSEEAGIGGLGLHSGGHIEGLDHVWIQSTSTDPVTSWADGVVTSIKIVGETPEEPDDIIIQIDYGFNLIGVHAHIETFLVQVGDNVKRGDPIGYGNSWTEGVQSAEFALWDTGRKDGVLARWGVCVSPFDYLIEEEKMALVDAYFKNVIDPRMESGEINGMFEPDQPYFTNPMLLHHGNEGKLIGEWYLVSMNWTDGDPNDMITIFDANNPYYKGTVIIGADDATARARSWNMKSECVIDYSSNQMSWINWGDETIYGIFEVDESEERAKLKLQYQAGSYPNAFTEEALIYIERSYYPRRSEGVFLGVLNDSSVLEE